mmetsp:Transcript_58470/g.143016  ORF Transcript_58470/g.143016 Transcript_58470/m.143016 type:complete len:224 (+) Transcript_58470:198-869(+)
MTMMMMINHLLLRSSIPLSTLYRNPNSTLLPIIYVFQFLESFPVRGTSNFNFFGFSSVFLSFFLSFSSALLNNVLSLLLVRVCVSLYLYIRSIYFYPSCGPFGFFLNSDMFVVATVRPINFNPPNAVISPPLLSSMKIVNVLVRWNLTYLVGIAAEPSVVVSFNCSDVNSNSCVGSTSSISSNPKLLRLTNNLTVVGLHSGSAPPLNSTNWIVLILTNSWNEI